MKFKVDKCDETVMSQTTISVSLAFDRIWMLAACPFRCINCQQIPTLASGMQATSSLSALHRRYGQLMAWNFLAHCNTRHKQSVLGDVIISFAQHYFYWNLCKAMFLFQLIGVLLISITFYIYLANIVFSCDLAFNQFTCNVSIK